MPKPVSRLPPPNRACPFQGTRLSLCRSFSVLICDAPAERPEVLSLVGIFRLPAEDTPGTHMVHMPRSESDFLAAALDP